MGSTKREWSHMTPLEQLEAAKANIEYHAAALANYAPVLERVAMRLRELEHLASQEGVKPPTPKGNVDDPSYAFARDISLGDTQAQVIDRAAAAIRRERLAADARVAEAIEECAKHIDEWGFSIIGDGEISAREAEQMARQTLKDLAEYLRETKPK